MTTTPGPLTGAPIARSITDRSEIPIPDEDQRARRRGRAGCRPGIARTWRSSQGSCHAPRTGTLPGGARARVLYFPPVSDLPLALPDDSAAAPAAPPSIGSARSIAPSSASAPSPDRDVLVLGGGADELARYAAGGARVTTVAAERLPLARRRRLGRRDRQRLVGVPRRRPGRPGRGRSRPPARRPAPRRPRLRPGRRVAPARRPRRARRLDPARRTVPVERLPRPRDPLLLDVRRRSTSARTFLAERLRRRRARSSAPGLKRPRLSLQRRGLPPDPRRGRCARSRRQPGPGPRPSDRLLRRPGRGAAALGAVEHRPVHRLDVVDHPARR